MKSTKELIGVKEVRLKEDKRVYYIYSIYDDTSLSLCLYGYDDAEQDFTTHISEVELIK